MRMWSAFSKRMALPPVFHNYRLRLFDGVVLCEDGLFSWHQFYHVFQGREQGICLRLGHFSILHIQRRYEVLLSQIFCQFFVGDHKPAGIGQKDLCVGFVGEAAVMRVLGVLRWLLVCRCVTMLPAISFPGFTIRPFSGNPSVCNGKLYLLNSLCHRL